MNCVESLDLLKNFNLYLTSHCMDILQTWCSYKRETWSPMITNFVADNNYRKTCLCSTKKSVTKLAPLFVYRFSVPTASVPSAWPSFSPLTCHKKWPPGILNIWNRQNKNPAPRGTRENKEENNIIILHLLTVLSLLRT